MAGERPILVTGAAGFIGSHLVRALMLEHGAPTVCLDALTYAGDLELLTDLDPTFVHGDICDRALVRQLLREHRPRAIFHLAAETHVDRSIDAADACAPMEAALREGDSLILFPEGTRNLDPERFPNISAHFDQLADHGLSVRWTDADQNPLDRSFEFMMQVLLDGLAARLPSTDG